MDILNSTLGSIFQNKYSSTIITIFLISYASLARSKLPSFMNKLFENSLFRIFLLSLIVYRGNKNAKLSILISMAFVVAMKFLSKQKIFDGFTNTDDTPGFDDNVADTDPDNVGMLDKHGSDIDLPDDGTGNLPESDTTDSELDMPPSKDDVYDNLEMDEDSEFETETEFKEYPETPEEEIFTKPEEEEYPQTPEEVENRPITEESEIVLEEELTSGEMCVNHSDGTDTCGDDEICDNGKCINAA